MNKYTGQPQIDTGVRDDRVQEKLIIAAGNNLSDAISRSKFRKTSLQAVGHTFASGDLKIEISNRSMPEWPGTSDDWVDITGKVTVISPSFVVIEFPFHLLRIKAAANATEMTIVHVQSNK